MNNPAYSCGDAFCCEGADWPNCQAPHQEPAGHIGAVHIKVAPSHYEDGQTSASPHTFTD